MCAVPLECGNVGGVVLRCRRAAVPPLGLSHLFFHRAPPQGRLFERHTVCSGHVSTFFHGFGFHICLSCGASSGGLSAMSSCRCTQTAWHPCRICLAQQARHSRMAHLLQPQTGRMRPCALCSHRQHPAPPLHQHAYALVLSASMDKREACAPGLRTGRLAPLHRRGVPPPAWTSQRAVFSSFDSFGTGSS